jgi:hypothetical protein
VFSVGSDPSLYNESLLVDRKIMNWGFRNIKRMGIQRGTTEYNRMRIQLSVGDSHGKLVVKEQLKVSLRRLSV